jgi:putative redox protein
MSSQITSASETENQMAQVVRVGAHTLRVDVSTSLGGTASAPDPHDLFDASLASCKATTAIWYARSKGYPLEHVECTVEREASQERAGTYTLRVHLVYQGPLTAEQRSRLHDVVARSTS